MLRSCFMLLHLIPSFSYTINLIIAINRLHHTQFFYCRGKSHEYPQAFLSILNKQLILLATMCFRMLQFYITAVNWRDFVNSFPYGKAALLMLLLAISSGLWLLFHPIHKHKSTLVFWTFAKTHYDFYKASVPSFEAAHPGVTVDVQLVSGAAVTTRLQAAFWADLQVPDLVETEISSAGSFFRGSMKNIGFEDLTDRIKSSGLWDEMVRTRFSPYTHRGRIFGIPHDVHPVQIAYRRDIFEREGIDASKIHTWDDFIKIGHELTVPGQRYMIELSDTDSSTLEIFLFQRGGGYFNQKGECIMDNEIAIQTLRWFIPLVAGPNKIANNTGGAKILTKSVEDGYLLCLMCPDWRTKSIEMDIPRVAGKMALMPLPVFKDGSCPTSTWGGTMLGITRRCKNKNLAWQFAMHIYTDKSGLAQRFRGTNIIPALRDAWQEPAFKEKRPYWSNQAIGSLYAALAPHVPPQYSSPFVSTAKAKFGEALTACAVYYRLHGEEGFEPYVRSRLKQSGDEVRASIRRNPF